MATTAEVTEIVSAIVKANSTPPICHFEKCMPNAEWAYWVQAIGALLALFATVAVVIYQQWTNRKLQQDRRYAFEKEAFLAINIAKQSIREFANVLAKPLIAKSYAMCHQESRFEDATRALANCQPSEFTGEMAILLVQGRKEFSTFRWLATVACLEIANLNTYSDTSGVFNEHADKLAEIEAKFIELHRKANKHRFKD